ncbi:MAG TPA: hypothetical protein V6D30_09070 [Leptolyngbyaceae cyanobacterium]
MVSEKQNSSQDKLGKFSEALAEARKMQHDWMTHGLDFVALYVEDVDGDWLERWGEDEQELVSDAPDAPQAVAVGQTLVGGAVVESVSAFLETDDPVAVQVRERLGGRSLSDIAIGLEKCWNLPEEDRSDALMDIFLAGGVTSGGTNRDSSDDNDGIELVELVDDLLEKLAEILGNRD